MSLTDVIWQAIQRPSPAVTRDEIEALVEEWTQKPTATEEPVRIEGMKYLCEIPAEYGAVKRMTKLGDGLAVVTDRAEWLLVSPEGKVTRVEPAIGEPVYTTDGQLHPMFRGSQWTPEQLEKIKLTG